MTMTVAVVRPGRDFTNGGESSRFDQLLVLAPVETAPAEASFPVMVLEPCTPFEASLRPLQASSDRYVGPMPGGNYAVGGADFQQEAVADLVGRPFSPVAIWDRYESQELHDTLAR